MSTRGILCALGGACLLVLAGTGGSYYISSRDTARFDRMVRELATIRAAQEKTLAAFHRTVAEITALEEKTLRSAAVEKLKAENEALSRAVAELEKKVKGLAASKLAPQYGGRAVIPFLAHSDSTVRQSALAILKRLADPECIEPLITLAASRADPGVRESAVSAISVYRGNEKVAKAVVPLLEDRDRNVRYAAYRACGAIGSPLLLEPLLAAFHREMEAPPQPGYSGYGLRYIAESLGRFEDIKAGNALLSLCIHYDRTIRNYAAEGFKSYVNPALVPHVLTLLEKAELPSPNEYSPFQAALLSFLARMREPRAAKIALRFLTCKNRYAARSAAEVFRSCIDPEVTPALVDAWRAAKDYSVKNILKHALSSGRYPVTWDEEKKIFLLDKERLEKMRKKGPVPRTETRPENKPVF